MPDFRAQFRSAGDGRARVYMGGTAMSCGNHPTLPKRHRWSAWFEVNYYASAAWERRCLTCALVDDPRWQKPRAAIAKTKARRPA